MKIQIIIIVLNICMLSQTNGHRHDDDYVDPTDLINFDPVNVRMKTSTKDSESIKDSDSQSIEMETPLNVVKIPAQNNNLQLGTCNPIINPAISQDCQNTRHSLESFTSLFRQYVNKLVHTLEPKVGKASNPVEINLRLRLTYHDLSKLRTYGEGGAQEIHDVHEILSYMIQYSSDVLQPESSINWLERKVGMPFVDLMQILVVTCTILMSLAMLPRIDVSKRIVPAALFLTFVVSVIFTWIEMYQKEVADQEKILMTERLSDHCPKMEELSVWARLTTYVSSTFSFQNEKCRNYFHAMLVNPMVKVSPLEAVAVVLVKTVVTPLEIIGTGIKRFFIGLLMDLPAQYQLLVIIMISASTVLILFFFCRYNFKILGLVSLGPSEVRHTVQGPPVTDHSGNDNNRVAYQRQRPSLPRPNSPDSQRIVSHSPQNTSLVPALARHEKCCNCNSSQLATQKVVSRLNNSGVLEKRSREEQLRLKKANLSQASNSENSQICPNENMTSAVGESLGDGNLNGIGVSEADSGDHSSQFLVERINDLTVADIPVLEDQAETHLATRMNSVTISGDLDQKD